MEGQDGRKQLKPHSDRRLESKGGGGTGKPKRSRRRLWMRAGAALSRSIAPLLHFSRSRRHTVSSSTCTISNATAWPSLDHANKASLRSRSRIRIPIATAHARIEEKLLTLFDFILCLMRLAIAMSSSGSRLLNRENDHELDSGTAPAPREKTEIKANELNRSVKATEMER